MRRRHSHVGAVCDDGRRDSRIKREGNSQGRAHRPGSVRKSALEAAPEKRGLVLPARITATIVVDIVYASFPDHMLRGAQILVCFGFKFPTAHLPLHIQPNFCFSQIAPLAYHQLYLDFIFVFGPL